ncbi:MAG TPA: zinc ribbon domain-containing protein [Pyrinomonadaceae bacterium]|nr:zinc ribbon domain-containing protein [Pyrinomonadaceae bacterium]
MFCPHCGNESAPELNYCKRCGGNLNPLAPAQPLPPAAPALTPRTAWAVGTTMLFVIVIGMGLLLTAVNELKHSGLPPDVMKMVLISGTFILLGSVAMLVWLWSRVLTGPRYLGAPPAQQQQPQQLGRPATNELGAAQFNPLSAAPSVTEHTTRTLERSRK